MSNAISPNPSILKKSTGAANMGTSQSRTVQHMFDNGYYHLIAGEVGVTDYTKKHFTPERYGAVGDGLVVDDAAISNWVDSAAAVGKKIIRGENEYRVQSTIQIPSNLYIKNTKIVVDGDTFTSSTSPAAIVANKTFNNLANSDDNIGFCSNEITLKNNTAAFSPKLVMFGGVKNGEIKKNKLNAIGSKHSAVVECYKSVEDIEIAGNKINIITGNVTGGGIWLTNKNSTETSRNIKVYGNVINQNCIDEIIAVFPVAGPMENISVFRNEVKRMNSGAATGPGLRAFVGDGLTGGTVNAKLINCRIYKNEIINELTTFTTSGFVQIGNYPTDSIDPEECILEDNIIRGVFTSSSVAVRGLMNSADADANIKNNKISYDSGSGTPTGINTTDGVLVSGNEVKDFNTNINTFNAEKNKVYGGSIGIIARKIASGNRMYSQSGASMRIRSQGAGTSPEITGNRFYPSINAACVQLDTNTSPSTIENATFDGNIFDGSATGCSAITKLGSQTVSGTRINSSNRYIGIAGANLWPSTIDAVVDIIGYNGTPESSVNASIGSRCSNGAGGAGTADYVKTVGTSNTGWSAVA